MWDLRCYQNQFFFFPFIQLSGISGAAVWPGKQPPLCRGVTPVFSRWAFLCTLPVPYEEKRDSSATLLQLPRYSGRFCSAFMEDLNSIIRQLMSPALCMSMYLFSSLIILCVDTIQKSILSIWEGRKVRTGSLGKIQFIFISTFNCSFCYMSSCFLGWMRNFYSIFAWFCIIFHVKIWDAEV